MEMTLEVCRSWFRYHNWTQIQDMYKCIEVIQYSAQAGRGIDVSENEKRQQWLWQYAWDTWSDRCHRHEAHHVRRIHRELCHSYADSMPAADTFALRPWKVNNKLLSPNRCTYRQLRILHNGFGRPVPWLRAIASAFIWLLPNFAYTTSGIDVFASVPMFVTRGLKPLYIHRYVLILRRKHLDLVSPGVHCLHRIDKINNCGQSRNVSLLLWLPLLIVQRRMHNWIASVICNASGQVTSGSLTLRYVFEKSYRIKFAFGGMMSTYCCGISDDSKCTKGTIFNIGGDCSREYHFSLKRNWCVCTPRPVPKWVSTCVHTLTDATLNESTNTVKMKEQYVEHIAPHNVELMNIQGGDIGDGTPRWYTYGIAAADVRILSNFANYLCLIGSTNREKGNPIKMILHSAKLITAQSRMLQRIECVRRSKPHMNTEYILAVNSTGNRLPLALKRMREDASHNIRWNAWIRLSSFCEYLLGKYWRACKRGVHKKWKAYFWDELLSRVCELDSFILRPTPLCVTVFTSYRNEDSRDTQNVCRRVNNYVNPAYLRSNSLCHQYWRQCEPLKVFIWKSSETS